jgi:HEPN domain-containing protein
MSDAAGWIASADTDLDTVRRCLIEPSNVVAAAYHCQQAAEKLIKVVLVALRIAYPRGRSGHDLGLAAAQIPSGHELREAAGAFDAIADWPISFRYPVDDPLQAEPLSEPSEVGWPAATHRRVPCGGRSVGCCIDRLTHTTRFARASTASNSTWQPASASSG